TGYFDYAPSSPLQRFRRVPTAASRGRQLFRWNGNRRILRGSALPRNTRPNAPQRAGQRKPDVPVKNPRVHQPLGKWPFGVARIRNTVAGWHLRPLIPSAEQLVPQRAHREIMVPVLLVDGMVDLVSARRNDDPGTA